MANPTRVRDINPGPANSIPFGFIKINNTLYFAADYSFYGTELWKSDGTQAGTVLVKDIYPDFGSSLDPVAPTEFVNIDGTLYFNASDPINGEELWKSDGTAAGTVLVKDITPSSSGFGPSELMNVNGILYFSTDADDGLGPRLWKSDGTQAGTVVVTDANSTSFRPFFTTQINNTLFFTDFGGGLWKSDGTATGTVLVKDFTLESNFSFFSSDPINANGVLYFTTLDNASGQYSLWKSNGTAVGTLLVKTFPVDSGPSDFVNVNGTLYLEVRSGANTSLWKSDGTAAGTVLVKDSAFLGNRDSASIGNFSASIGNILYFVSDNPSTGQELWKTDGTTAGTVLVKDIKPGTSGSRPRFLTNVNGTLYFAADDGAIGYELWKSDGTATGTVLVQDIAPGPTGSFPGYFIEMNGAVYFTASDGSGKELWKLDLNDNIPSTPSPSPTPGSSPTFGSSTPSPSPTPGSSPTPLTPALEGIAAPAPKIVFGRITSRKVGTARPDVINGGSASELLNGGAGTDRLSGNQGDDWLIGGQGNDRAKGGVGTDRLEGGTGNDTLIGGAGSDRLVGGVGGDTLTGGAGKDLFVLDSTGDANADTITDFKIGEDLIDLRPIFSKSGYQSAALSQVVNLLQIGANTEVWIDADGLGSGTALLKLATLRNLSASTLSADQFVIK